MTRKEIGVTTPYRRANMDNVVREWDNPDQTKAAINAKLEQMAVECERMPFGDTAASFAAWIRGQKL